MALYYYLVAGLPMLHYSVAPSLSSEKFLSQCRELAGAAAAEEIKAAKLVPDETRKKGNRFLREWIDREISLRNALVRLRAPRTDFGPAAIYERSGKEIFGSQALALSILDQEDPLKGEFFLNRKRWDFLCDCEYRYYFSLESLMIYNLKLQILERNMLLTPERGSSVFSGLVSMKIQESKLDDYEYETKGNV